MAAVGNDFDRMPVVRRVEDFDARSGNLLERLVFNNRLAMIVACAVVTVVLGYFAATRVVLNASFEKMIPQSQPYIQNYLTYQKDLRGLGNAIRVVVENSDGSIFDPDYLEALKQINDELFLTPGVDRAWVKSLWTPGVRWTEVTEEGFRGGPVMPDGYDGSPRSVEQLKQNIARAGILGSLVADNFKSSMIFVPLLDKEAGSGRRIDYHGLSRALEDKIRARYELAKSVDKTVAARQTPAIRIHVIGFAKLIGELIDGLFKVMMFFAIAALIATAVIFTYTRCVRSTALVIACSIVAVAWQLGLIALFGFELDPFSILVPFLVFAIGVSHGAQKMNGIMQDIGRGTHKQVAARYTYRRLFVAGLTALLADAVGFAVLMVIDIPVIRDLALTASVGVAVLIFTNLLLLPVLLSYTGVSAKAAQHSLREEREETAGKGFGALWKWLDRFTTRRWALGAIGVAAVLAVVGAVANLHLKIGDLDPGAPELRPDSRYNRDNAYITQNYALSSDQFAVIVKTEKEGCLKYPTLVEADRLAWHLKQVPGVQTTVSLAGCGAPDHRRVVRGQPEVAHDQPQPGRAQLRGAAGLGQQSGPVQPGMLGDAGDRLPGRPQGGDAEPGHGRCRAILCRTQRPGSRLPARRRQRRHRGRHQHRGRGGQLGDVPVRVRGGDRTVLHRVSQLARRDRRGGSARAHLDPVRRADGGARHRRQGVHAARDRAGRGHRRRLRALPALGAAAAPAQGTAARRGLPEGRAVHRQGGRARRHHARGGCGDLGALADQVPGRHGHPAHLHVPLEHAGRADPHSGAFVRAAAHLARLHREHEWADGRPRTPRFDPGLSAAKVSTRSPRRTASMTPAPASLRSFRCHELSNRCHWPSICSAPKRITFHQRQLKSCSPRRSAP